jgi:hypothetical protein
MQRNPIRVACAVALAAIVAALAACDSPKVREAREHGAAAAERGIAAGEECLLGLGLVAPWSSPLDPETGLLRYSNGCEISDESTAYADAFNERVLAALHEGRLAGRTFRDKATTLAAVEQRFRGVDVVTVSLGGARVAAPGGRFEVEVSPRHPPQAPSVDTPYLFVTDTTNGSRRELTYLAPGETSARILFDHGGTTLLVAPIRLVAQSIYRTFDLPRAVELQAFVAESGAK